MTMTTLTPTMEAMLAELALLTKARRDNWNGQDQPRNAELEAEHLREMRRLKAGISRENSHDQPR